ncbi:capsid protein [Staphylococcus sp. IVB6238]|uniref:capsid protein n=1 Tax=Staphylococcus sp. IVB6238 TaxID=2989770 RepID=UPI0021CF007A|nr:capsid protein [Staphylococcus sp. IVB6238]UXR73303.1 capsid protein [Staphylococcus sp. IVB6238]
MGAEVNLIDVQALGQAKSIDLATKMGNELNGLFKVLNITSKLPLNIGSAIKTYSYDIVESSKPNGDVAEGDIIPLTKVERKVVDIGELTFTKFRKSTSIEAIQAHGYDIAIQDTDQVVLRYVQKKFKQKFYSTLESALSSPERTNTEQLTAKNLQGALAVGRANLVALTDSDDLIAFVNPKDVAKHMAEGLIVSNGSQFGIKLLNDYVGVRLVEDPEIMAGEVRMTTSQNIKVVYANPRGEISRAFPLTTDETGFVGVLHDIQAERLTADTVYASAVTMYPENIDEVVKVRIQEEPTV